MAMARRAGIQPLVVTGDHPRTRGRHRRGGGLDTSHVVTGAELDAWDDDRLRRELPAMRIVARAVPEQKLRLVEAARAAGRTVAVTGDGVNDAPGPASGGRGGGHGQRHRRSRARPRTWCSATTRSRR